MTTPETVPHDGGDVGAAPAILRPWVILTLFMIYTLPLMPLQAVLRRFWPRAARNFPRAYHRGVCRLLGIRLNIRGQPLTDGPSLMVSNHSSWLDIPVLSSAKPLSFVSKREVADWPLFGTLARLQNTVFVDRDRRSATGQMANTMQQRLGDGDTLVLFPEGTSSDGHRVLAFRTALFAAADIKVPQPGSATARAIAVQPVSVTYSRLHGLPLGRRNRPLFVWHGDMTIASHIWGVLKSGPLDAELYFHAPVHIDQFTDRKQLAAHCEAAVRAGVIAALAGRDVEAHSLPDLIARDIATE